MKKLFSVLSLILLAGILNTTDAQVKKEVKEDAKAVGNKAAELGSKAKAKVTDKTYADKVGPDGQTIYIDRHSKYYWIDDKGAKRYIAKTKLKDKH